MMEKKIIKKPVYEYVQVGERDEEVYTTSDGREFHSEKAALEHENHLYWQRINEKSLEIPYHVAVVKFDSNDDVKQFVEEEGKSIDSWVYHIKDTDFPNKFVVARYEEEAVDDDTNEFYEEHVAHLYTLDEWKRITIEKINAIK